MFFFAKKSSDGNDAPQNVHVKDHDATMRMAHRTHLQAVEGQGLPVSIRLHLSTLHGFASDVSSARNFCLLFCVEESYDIFSERHKVEIKWTADD